MLPEVVPVGGSPDAAGGRPLARAICSVEGDPACSPIRMGKPSERVRVDSAECDPGSSRGRLPER